MQFCNVLFEMIILKILNERSTGCVFYLIIEKVLWVKYAAKYYVTTL